MTRASPAYSRPNMQSHKGQSVRVSHPFDGESEARFQLERWSPAELAYSRRMIAKEYASRPWLLRLYRSLLPSRGSNRVGNILDVGCGTGFFTRFVANKVVAPLKGPKTAVGVDLNRGLLRAARGQRPAGDFAFEYVQASAYFLPFRSGSFDLVTCRTVLMHLSSPLGALREMRRTAKEGGRVACEEPDHGMVGGYDPGDDPVFARGSRRVRAAEVRGLLRMYGQDYEMGRRLPELFHGAGLRGVTLEGMFRSITVPCDPRIKATSLEERLSAELSYYSDKVHLEDYKRTLRAGGLSPKEIDGYLKVWRRKKVQRIRALRLSSTAKEDDVSFLAVPFFLAVGRKPLKKQVDSSLV